MPTENDADEIGKQKDSKEKFLLLSFCFFTKKRPYKIRKKKKLFWGGPGAASLRKVCGGGSLITEGGCSGGSSRLNQLMAVSC